MAYDSVPYSLYGSKARVAAAPLFTNNPATSRMDDTSPARRYPDCLNTSLPEFLSHNYDGARHWDIGTRFGQRLRELRHTHRMTQIDMAVMLGIDRSYISEVERGKKGISLVTLEIIALGFRLHLSDLLRDL